MCLNEVEDLESWAYELQTAFKVVKQEICEARRKVKLRD